MEGLGGKWGVMGEMRNEGETVGQKMGGNMGDGGVTERQQDGLNPFPGGDGIWDGMGYGIG